MRVSQSQMAALLCHQEKEYRKCETRKLEHTQNEKASKTVQFRLPQVRRSQRYIKHKRATTWQNQHPPSLIRVFAVRMKKAWVLSYPLSAQTSESTTFAVEKLLEVEHVLHFWRSNMFYISGGRTCFIRLEVEHVLHFWRSNMFYTSGGRIFYTSGGWTCFTFLEVEHVLHFLRSNMFYSSGGRTSLF